MSEKLTIKERHAVDLMFEAHRRYPDERYEAATCSYETFLDSSWPVFLNFHTAKSLLRKGLVVVIDKDVDAGWSIALTDDVLRSRGMERTTPDERPTP